MNIIAQLEQYGFNTEYGIKCVESNRHNHVTTTYNLLLKKYLQNGGQSVADVTSDFYERSMASIGERYTGGAQSVGPTIRGTGNELDREAKGN